MTVYVSEDGKVKEISEMNNFHLLNALLKVGGTLALNPNGFGDAVTEYESTKTMHKALKDEVLKRMDNRPAQS